MLGTHDTLHVCHSGDVDGDGDLGGYSDEAFFDEADDLPHSLLLNGTMDH